MRKLETSSTRRLLMWFFDEPSNDPYVTLNFDVDIAPLRAFLDAFEREHGMRASVQHAVTRAVARCLVEIPALNVKVFGGRLHALDRVDIAVPVHLSDDHSNGRDETGITIVRDVHRKSLLEVARDTRGVAADERNGKLTLSGTSVVRRAARYVPDAILRPALDAVSWTLSRPSIYSLLEPTLNVSSVVTNVGAVFGLPKGARFRAASATIPTKLGPIATVFGVAPTEEAAVVEDGRVGLRTVLPLVMIVDHRAVDGVLMARAASRIAEALLDPARLA